MKWYSARTGRRPLSLEKSCIKGVWGVGLASRRCNVNEVPLGENTESWVVRQDGAMYHDKQQKGKLPEVPQEGDVLVRSVIHVGVY